MSSSPLAERSRSQNPTSVPYSLCEGLTNDFAKGTATDLVQGTATDLAQSICWIIAEDVHLTAPSLNLESDPHPTVSLLD